jgi:hypothetical protein
MTRGTRRKPSPPPPASLHRLSGLAAEKHNDAEQRINIALDTVAKDIDSNGGVSSYGRISIQLILKLARLNSAYLEKKRPKIVSLKDRVLARLKELSEETPATTGEVRTAFSRKTQLARAEADAIRSAYALAELEHAATLDQLEAAEARISELERANGDLRQQIAKVIRIPNRSAF